MSAMLPDMLYPDEIRKNVQTSFGGYNHNLYAADGGLWDMENLSSDLYPVLSTRKPRHIVKTFEKPNGIYAVKGRNIGSSEDVFLWVDKNKLYKSNQIGGTREEVGEVEDSKKTFCTIGDYVIILPDKKCYKMNDDSGKPFGDLEARWDGAVIFQDGTFASEPASANTIYSRGVSWDEYFKAGDAVSISGCKTYPQNNMEVIIREIDGDKLYFYENTFTLAENGNPVTEAVAITRLMPDLDFICENENRLWGCCDNTIYASKLGDPFNWNVFDGLSTDSFAANVGSDGAFTGCISYLGYPHFFKEDNIYKVYGDKPQNFQVVKSAGLGVMAGSEKSLAILGGTLFYLSREGMVSYSGGLPQNISEPFGNKRYRDAAAGSDGRKYYISMFDEEEARYCFFAFDVQRGLWHKEDYTQAIDFCYLNDLYFLDNKGTLWLTPNARRVPSGAHEDEKVYAMAEFGDFTGQSPNKKGVSKMQMRLELAADAYLKVYIQFDSDGYWQEAANFYTAVKKSFQLPIIPRRCDHFRIKLTGVGQWRLYSLTTESYVGSAM